MTVFQSGWAAVPPQRREPIARALAPQESIVAWVETDLDRRSCFAPGIVVLTERRILASEPQDGTPGESLATWDRTPALRLRYEDDGTLGRIELCDETRRLAEWRVTARRASAARRFVDAFSDVDSATATATASVAAMPSDASPTADDSRAFTDAAARSAAGGEQPNASDEAIEDDVDAILCSQCGAPVPRAERECPQCGAFVDHPSRRSLLRLVRFARRRAAPIVLGFVLTVAATGAALVPPYLTIPLLDDILIPLQNGQSADPGRIKWFLAGLGGAAVLAWLLGWARTWVLAWVAERISSDLRNEAFAHLQRLSLDYYGRRRTGDLISRVGNDTERICNFLSIDVIDLANDALMIVMTIAILFSIDPVLTVVTLAPIPLIAWLAARVRHHLRTAFAGGSRAWAEMINVLSDAIPGIRVVKAFAQERRETARFRAANDHVLAANDRINFTWTLFGPMVVLFTDLGLLVVWAAGAWGVIDHRITVGVLTAFLAYIGRFYARLDSMTRVAASVERAAAGADRLFDILDAPPGVAEPERPVRIDGLQGAIELRNVRFQYGTRPVLRGIDLSIRPGEMIGLVGVSGGGKTTLVNLVCRFYDVSGGAILVDGRDVRELSLEQYRSHIGLVLQEPFLFYGTIAENIAYGRPHATPAEIVAAARAARAHDFILRLPEGYDSIVGERGQLLSGGERQRISIARALLIDPRILILDEATSSVDTETEREIQAAIENLVRGRTTIAIAHRLSTLRRADRLVVLDQGRIVEVGAHEELLARPGVYARLHAAQLESAAAHGA